MGRADNPNHPGQSQAETPRVSLYPVSERRSIVTPSTILHSLILKQRESVPSFQSTKRGWNQVSPEDVLLSSNEMEDEPTPMYPLHTGVAVSGERIDQQRTTRVLLLREKMKELHKKASKYACLPLTFPVPLKLVVSLSLLPLFLASLFFPSVPSPSLNLPLFQIYTATNSNV